MSAWVYEFKEPVSSVRLDDNGGHVTVTVFVRGKRAGDLVLSSPQTPGVERYELPRMLDCFTGRRVARFWRGGAGEEDVVEWRVSGPPARGDYFLAEPIGTGEPPSVITRADLKAMREIRE